MKYTKQFFSYAAQADQLLARGLQGDRATLIGHLESVSYYRLSGYWHLFRHADPAGGKKRLDTFVPGATVEAVWDRYVFDRRLRLLVMDAIERIEIDARTRLAYLHAEQYGPFGYAADPASLPNLRLKERTDFLDVFRRLLTSSEDTFVVHFRDTYGDQHNDLPIWVACELMTFGNMYMFYRGSNDTIKKAVAMRYGVMDAVCTSWLKTLNTVRNICAHHSRLWNRVSGIKPFIPSKDRRWLRPVPIPNDRMFAILTICRHLLGVIAPGNEWTDRFKQLLVEFPNIAHSPQSGLGLIPDWEKHPLWQ